MDPDLSGLGRGGRGDRRRCGVRRSWTSPASVSTAVAARSPSAAVRALVSRLTARPPRGCVRLLGIVGQVQLPHKPGKGPREVLLDRPFGDLQGSRDVGDVELVEVAQGGGLCLPPRQPSHRRPERIVSGIQPWRRRPIRQPGDCPQLRQLAPVP